MERTQIYIDSESKRILQQMAEDRKTTMAELIREAVEQYIAKAQKQDENILKETKGLWKDRDDIGDSIKYVNDMRTGWSKRIEEYRYGDFSD